MRCTTNENLDEKCREILRMKECNIEAFKNYLPNELIELIKRLHFHNKNIREKFYYEKKEFLTIISELEFKNSELFNEIKYLKNFLKMNKILETEIIILRDKISNFERSFEYFDNPRNIINYKRQDKKLNPRENKAVKITYDSNHTRMKSSNIKAEIKTNKNTNSNLNESDSSSKFQKMMQNVNNLKLPKEISINQENVENIVNMTQKILSKSYAENLIKTESETKNAVKLEQNELSRLSHNIKELEDEIFNNSQILTEIVRSQKLKEGKQSSKMKNSFTKNNKTKARNISCSIYNCKQSYKS